MSFPNKSPLGAGRVFTTRLGDGAVAAVLRRPKNPNGLRAGLGGVASGIGAGAGAGSGAAYVSG